MRKVQRWPVKVVSEKELENSDAEQNPGTAQTDANSIHLALVFLKVFSYACDGLEGA